MKTKNLFIVLLVGLGLLTQALNAQNGPANRRGPAAPESTPIANPEECPYYAEFACPGCDATSPADCPYALEGTCPNNQYGPTTERGPQDNPLAEPKRDGTGGPGKPANPAGPQDGTAPGKGNRGGRG